MVKMDESKWQQFLALHASGMSIRAAAREIGVAHTTLLRGYPKYEEMISRMRQKQELEDRIIQELYEKVLSWSFSQRVNDLLNDMTVPESFQFTITEDQRGKHRKWAEEISEMATGIEEMVFQGLSKFKDCAQKTAAASS